MGSITRLLADTLLTDSFPALETPLCRSTFPARVATPRYACPMLRSASRSAARSVRQPCRPPAPPRPRHPRLRNWHPAALVLRERFNQVTTCRFAARDAASNWQSRAARREKRSSAPSVQKSCVFQVRRRAGRQNRLRIRRLRTDRLHRPRPGHQATPVGWADLTSGLPKRQPRWATLAAATFPPRRPPALRARQEVPPTLRPPSEPLDRRLARPARRDARQRSTSSMACCFCCGAY